MKRAWLFVAFICLVSLGCQTHSRMANRRCPTCGPAAGHGQYSASARAATGRDHLTTCRTSPRTMPSRCNRPDRPPVPMLIHTTRSVDREISFSTRRPPSGIRPADRCAGGVAERSRDADGPLRVETRRRMPPSGRVYPTKRRTMSVMFWPPKPKLLFRATSHRASRAVLGT